MTLYIVLRRVESGEDRDVGHWQVLSDPVEASTDRQAIKKATDGLTEALSAGTFVVVPARSFKPVSRAIQTVQKDEWS